MQKKDLKMFRLELKKNLILICLIPIHLTFYIDKGKKVKVNEVNFYGNEQVSDLKLKKQMKGTKEMTKFTLFPSIHAKPLW